MELRSLRGGNPLTLDPTGEWTDFLYLDTPTGFVAMIVGDGGFGQAGMTTLHSFRCVFRPLP